MNNRTSAALRSKKGFTLIEVIAVLVLLGILAAVAVPRYIDVADTARDRAVDAAIAELNGREAVAWAQSMIAGSGTADDAAIFTAVNHTSLGGDFLVTGDGPYTITMSGTAVTVARTGATSIQPGRWARQ